MIIISHDMFILSINFKLYIHHSTISGEIHETITLLKITKKGSLFEHKDMQQSFKKENTYSYIA